MKTILILMLSAQVVLGQGFGSFSHDQPFFAKDAAPTNTPFFDTNIFFWWVASDLSTNSSGITNGWVDRIHSLILTQSVAALRPLVVSNYVEFTSDYISNVFPANLSSDWMIGMTLSAPGPWGGQQCLWNRAVSVPLSTYGSAWYLRDNTDFDDSLFFIANWNIFTNGIIYDWVLMKTNNGSNWETVYTNGVLQSATDIGPGVYDLSAIGIGMQSDGSTRPWLNGKIYEIIVWTNAVNLYSLSTATASNYHRYRTNTYGTYIP